MKTVGIMVDIKHLAAEGLNKSQIARRLHLDRSTVAKYLAMDEMPERTRRKQVPRKIDDYIDHIKARIAKYPELTAERIYREIAELGYTGSRRSVRRYLSTIRPKQERVYKPFETLPGEQAQVDWGHEKAFGEDGKPVNRYSFCFILGYSRVRYVEYTTSQDMATFLACLERALRYIGGCPGEIVFDNCKTVVSERIGDVVRFTDDLLRFAVVYGFRPRACWVNDPESKGKVESTVKYARRDFYYGNEHLSHAEVNRKVRVWMDQVANRKVSETTRRVPFELLEEERSFFRPLPALTRSAAYAEKGARVSKACLISVDGNQYSVPHRLARQAVTLRLFETQIEVYTAGELAVTLPRCHGKGQRIIQEEHYTGRHTGNKRASLQQRFESLGPIAREYLQGLAQANSGGFRDQVESILALCDTYGTEAVYAAMERAAQYRNYSYKAIKRILLQQERNPDALPQPPGEQLPVTVPVPAVEVQQRSPHYYAQVGRP
mgnify:CR=1 FL=1